jgi:hypothetical protein
MTFCQLEWELSRSCRTRSEKLIRRRSSKKPGWRGDLARVAGVFTSSRAETHSFPARDAKSGLGRDNLVSKIVVCGF